MAVPRRPLQTPGKEDVPWGQPKCWVVRDAGASGLSKKKSETLEVGSNGGRLSQGVWTLPVGEGGGVRSEKKKKHRSSEKHKNETRNPKRGR